MVLDFFLNHSTHMILCRVQEQVQLKCKLPGLFVCSFKELFVVLPSAFLVPHSSNNQDHLLGLVCSFCLVTVLLWSLMPTGEHHYLI